MFSGKRTVGAHGQKAGPLEGSSQACWSGISLGQNHMEKLSPCPLLSARQLRGGIELTLPSDEATNVCDTVENVPKIAIAKSMICLTIVCAASATAPRAAQQPQVSHSPPHLNTKLTS